jgi:molybdate transport system regulatory protein
MSEKNLEPDFKIWLKGQESYSIGKGGIRLLSAIEKYGSITKAAKKIGFSYKYAWDKIEDIEKALGVKIIKTRIGGISGGGAELTDEARSILKKYYRTQEYMKKILPDNESWESISMKISARNRLKGIVKNVEKDEVSAKIKIKITLPTTVTAVITREAVEDLDIQEGDTVEAVIKSTEVMIAK